jgi:phosphatidylinositol-4,5-bisphosphate 3-kinase
MEAQSFSLEDCKVMDSKKMPLWLAVTPKCIEDDEELQL